MTAGSLSQKYIISCCHDVSSVSIQIKYYSIYLVQMLHPLQIAASRLGRSVSTKYNINCLLSRCKHVTVEQNKREKQAFIKKADPPKISILTINELERWKPKDFLFCLKITKAEHKGSHFSDLTDHIRLNIYRLLLNIKNLTLRISRKLSNDFADILNSIPTNGLKYVHKFSIRSAQLFVSYAADGRTEMTMHVLIC